MKVDLMRNTFKGHSSSGHHLGRAYILIDLYSRLFIKLGKIWESEKGISLITWLYLDNISDILGLLFIDIIISGVFF